MVLSQSSHQFDPTSSQSRKQMHPLISCKDISFAYAGTPAAIQKLSPKAATPGSFALTNITLDIFPGEFLGIIGPSGAGKTTLASVLSGAIPHHFEGAFYGTCLVNDKDTCELTLTDISQVVGSVLQDIDTQMVASVVEDELLFGLENFGVPHNQIEDRLTWALQTVQIENLRTREIATLSGGQKQKVAIAAILALKPQVLILDEPTAALDPASTELVFATLKEVCAQGVTVVVIEQKVADLAAFCDRIAVMNKGMLALIGTPQEVFSHSRELRQIGVDSPRMARVYNLLAEAGYALDTQVVLDVTKTAELIGALVQGTPYTQTPGQMPAQTAAQIPTQASVQLPALTPTLTPTPTPKNEPDLATTTPSAPAVELSQVNFTYPQGTASVNNLNLTVYPHQILALIGENGAGKTTLTKLVNGLLHPQSGTVTIAGYNTAQTPTSKIAGVCATLFQNPDFQLCKNTVLEEVAFGLELQGVVAQTAQERALKVIQEFGLNPSDAPFSLSRGQRQMVALASVVVMKPQVVLLDEPTSGLDYRECMTVMNTVAQLARAGCAVVMVCHDMEVVSDFATDIAVMAQGKLLAQGPAQEIFRQPELMAAARVAPPQVVELSQNLVAAELAAFKDAQTVEEIVAATLELM